MVAEQRARILRGAPYFPVPDVDRIGGYYQRVFGFECEYSAGDPAEFAVYSRSGVPIMFRRVEDAASLTPNEQQGGTWDVFFWVDDVDALFIELTEADATFVYTPVVQPYGIRELAVRDPNGYVLGFGQTWEARSGRDQ